MDVNEKLKEVYELSILYDFYGELLGDHKKQIFEDYVLNDLSLAEIADNTGISRQGVHDMIRRCTKALRGYEKALHLAEKFGRIKELVGQIKELSGEIGEAAGTSLEEGTVREAAAFNVPKIVECATLILQEL
ncbi:MAG: YlxM family DNA-binding protein [Lachnospiraceae bacterium]|nr:YlxM family DNA-binding protein [Lachnospiraceae bacterium]